jgi:hypothetical protein
VTCLDRNWNDLDPAGVKEGISRFFFSEAKKKETKNLKKEFNVEKKKREHRKKTKKGTTKKKEMKLKVQ